jgi:hypothetical protein
METIKQVFQVERDDIVYLRVTLESYDGMAVVRTVDPLKALIEVQIAPGCQGMVHELLEDLMRREGIELIPQSR